MTNYNALIWVCIGAIIVIGFLYAISVFQTPEWPLFGLGTAIGIILFLVSAKNSKTSMTIMFVLLNDETRKILENLEEERSLDDLAMRLGMTTDEQKSKISTNLAFLKKRKFVTEKKKNGVTKFTRNW